MISVIKDLIVTIQIDILILRNCDLMLMQQLTNFTKNYLLYRYLIKTLG